MKIRMFASILLLLSSSVYVCAQDAEEFPYRYNKVYDYANDTMPTRPFHIDSLLRVADKQIGKPYVSPGRTPAGFDCSGFTFYCFREYGIYLPYTAHQQAEIGKEVALAEAQAGDLIFFQGYDLKDKAVHHVAILVNKKGEKLRFVHSASHGVHYDSFDSPYYHPRYITIRRVH